MRNITHGVMSMLLASWALACPTRTAKGGMMAQRTRQVRVRAKLLLVILASMFILGSPGMLLGQEAADQLSRSAPPWSR